MKKKNLLLAALAITALAGCSDDSFVGDQEALNAGINGNGEITFGSTFKAITRAGDHVGADAADLLGGKFYVGGYKHDGSAYSTVFDNYLVQWGANTAGTTTDNTSDWKYVGLTPLRFHITSGDQTIKYWDFAASYYNFVAYSPGKDQSIIIASSEGHPTTNEILASAIDQNNLETAAYTLQGSAVDLGECYIANLVTAKKSGASAPDINYKDEVAIKFRRLGSKVRIALYETIPGYSVRNVTFYAADGTPIKYGADGYVAPTTTPTLFAASNIFHTTGTMTIYFPTIGTTNREKSDYNKAHVTFAPGTGDEESSTMTFDALNYETTKAKWEDNRLDYTGNENVYLKRTAAAPSFAGTDPYYVTVLPDEAGNVLELRVDYTLEAIDGTKETIKIHGAKAFVPQVYAQWKPNYAYTYLFKISDNTNGWTSELTTDPAGLYPITFDAIVLDSEEGTQSTITTVATPAITTYQKGHVYNDGTPDDDYKTGKDIYVMVQDAELKTNLDSKGQLYTVTGSNITEATVMDALNIQTSTSGSTITGRNGIALTTASSTAVVEIAATDSPDGNAVSVTKKVTLSARPDDWGTNYYTDAACTSAAGDYANGEYYRKNTAAKFTPSAGTYAYAYEVSDETDTDIYSAVNFAKDASAPDGWDASDASKMEWYKDPDGNTKCSGAWDSSTFDSTNGKTYYRHYTNLNKVYSVKVIKVVAGS